MKTRFDKFSSLGIPFSIVKEASLSESESDNVSLRIKLLKPFLTISNSWQLDLLTGRLDDYKQHAHKHNIDNNVIFYAICSESIDALQWLYENHRDLFALYQFINDYSAATAFLKSHSLLNWLFHSEFISLLTQDQAKMFLLPIGGLWINGLNSIKELNPQFIEEHGSILIHLSIVNKKWDLFQWAVQNMPTKLMAVKYFQEAVVYGMLEAVSWFLEFAPSEVINYKNQNGTTVLHHCAISKSNRVFNRITELKKEALLEADNKDRYITEYALNSLSANRLNQALQLTNSTTLKIRYVATGMNVQEPDQEAVLGHGDIKDVLAFTINQVTTQVPFARWREKVPEGRMRVV